MVDFSNKLGIVDLATMSPDKLHGNIYKYMMGSIHIVRTHQ